MVNSCDILQTSIDDLLKEKISSENEEDKNYYYTNNISEWFSEWDFKKYNPNIYSHGFHQYPAKFIPQLVRKLLRFFTDENSVVLDIFSGSGTSLIESLLLNRKKAIGIELNPFACFMAKVKTTPINPSKLQYSFAEIELNFNNITNFKIANFNNIDFWFKKDIKIYLSKLKSVIDLIKDEDIKSFFLLSFSELIRKVSLTKHNGFKLHRDKNKLNDSFNPDILIEFKKICERNIALMSSFYHLVKDNHTELEIINGDTTKIQRIEKNSVDFILTSPPYGDSKTTVAYGQFSRLSWQWLNNDLNINSLDDRLLGGKKANNLDNDILKYSDTLKRQLDEIAKESTTRAKEVLSFYIDLFKSLENSYQYLKNGKYFVLVTGNRTVKDVFLRTDLIINEFAEKIGFNAEKTLHRNIVNKRMPDKNSPTNEKGKIGNTMLKENIIFLRKR